MEIVSGRVGRPHVTSQQFRQIIEGIVGDGSCILPSGENLEPELVSNNSLKIRSGMICHHGNVSSVKIGTYDEVELTNGSQGMKRIDLVVNRYTRNEEDNTEKNEWIVIMGTPAESNPTVPEYTKGNLQEGDLVDDCPAFEVHFDGINITEVTKMLEIAQTNKDLSNKLGNLGQSAAIGQYGSAWNVGTSYQNVGSKLPAVSNDLYETVSGNDAVIKIKKPGTYLLLASSEFGTNAGVGGTVWNAIVLESGTEITRSCAYVYGGSATTVISHMLQVESSITIKLCSARSAGSGTIQNKGKDLLQCIKIL